MSAAFFFAYPPAYLIDAAPVAFPAPEPALKVEQLRGRRQPQADHQANSRDQLIMSAGDTFDPEEIAGAKVFDPGVVLVLRQVEEHALLIGLDASE